MIYGSICSTAEVGIIAKESSTYLFHKRMLQGGLWKISYSIFYITNSAMTTDMGDPLEVPVICKKVFSLYWKKVDSKQSFVKLVTSSFSSEVRFKISSSSRIVAVTISIARSYRMLVNRHFTSSSLIFTKVFCQFSSYCSLSITTIASHSQLRHTNLLESFSFNFFSDSFSFLLNYCWRPSFVYLLLWFLCNLM